MPNPWVRPAPRCPGEAAQRGSSALAALLFRVAANPWKEKAGAATSLGPAFSQMRLWQVDPCRMTRQNLLPLLEGDRVGGGMARGIHLGGDRNGAPVRQVRLDLAVFPAGTSRWGAATTAPEERLVTLTRIENPPCGLPLGSICTSVANPGAWVEAAGAAAIHTTAAAARRMLARNSLARVIGCLSFELER
jgi:hypothetical protein